MLDYGDLIEQSVAGDLKSQRMLYDALKGRLIGICLRYNRNQEDANDVFQEAMIRLFRNIHKAKEVTNFNAWVKRIATNASIDAYNRRKSTLTIAIEDSEVMQFTSDEANALDKLEAEEILKLLQQLPDNQRVVFNLYMIDGYSHKEIAKELRVAVSTSRVLLTRAKRMMIELLKKTDVHERFYG